MTAQIDAFKQQADDIKAAIDVSQPSLRVFAEDILRRSLVVAAASQFEHELCAAIKRLFEAEVRAPECLALVESKAIKRQFYSYFDFNSANTNKLFACFGPAAKERAVERLKADADASSAQEAFLKICSLRNNMVHENFVAFPVELSTDEIYAAFQLGARFIPFFERVVRNVQ